MLLFALQLLAQGSGGGGDPGSGSGGGGDPGSGSGGGDALITNPILSDFLGTRADLGGGNAGNIIAWLIVTIWRTIMVLAGVFVIFWFIYGGVTWLTAGGDKQKLENARNRIVNAIIGLALLFATFAIVNFLGPAIGFDILKLETSSPTQSTTTHPPGSLPATAINYCGVPCSHAMCICVGSSMRNPGETVPGGTACACR